MWHDCIESFCAEANVMPCYRGFIECRQEEVLAEEGWNPIKEKWGHTVAKDKMFLCCYTLKPIECQHTQKHIQRKYRVNCVLHARLRQEVHVSCCKHLSKQSEDVCLCQHLTCHVCQLACKFAGRWMLEFVSACLCSVSVWEFSSFSVAVCAVFQFNQGSCW